MFAPLWSHRSLILALSFTLILNSYAALDSISLGSNPPKLTDQPATQLLDGSKIEQAKSSSHSLSLKDVQPIIQKMLAVHIEYRRLDKALMARIINNYLQEFDPLKVYLLQSEVDSYVDSKPHFFEEALEKFQKEDYRLFEELDHVIQKSIWRAREWAQMATAANNPDTSIHFEVSANRSSSIDELKWRWQSLFVNREPAELAHVKQWMLQNENDYLYCKAQGVPLSIEEKGHLQALHILKAVAPSLDAHSAVFTTREADNIRSFLEQSYLGVGIYFENQSGHWIVKQIIEGSPAAVSGEIQLGDEWVTLEGEKIDKELDPVSQIKGESGTNLRLGFMRLSQGYEVTLKLQEIAIDTGRVHWDFRTLPTGGNIGYLSMDTFYERDQGSSSESDMLAAIRSLQQRGELKALILDLRNDGGGFLDQAVKVVGLFIKTGVVAISKYADGSLNYYRDTDSKCIYQGPLLVMTSRQTASAAEVVSEALQDYGVALVLGDHATFGKGSIQMQNITDPGADAFYKVTVGRYYTVSGESPQLSGVPINFIVPGPLDLQPVGESFEANPLAADKMAPAYIDTLSDVAPKDRAWFVQHYLPTLQQRNFFWASRLPALQQSSGSRVKSFFAERAYDLRTGDELRGFQLNEAYQIATEMAAQMSEKQKLQESSAQKAAQKSDKTLEKK